MYAYYIAKATENFGLPATRPIYQRAIESLPDSKTAEMCLRFANLEQKLGEIDRARASASPSCADLLGDLVLMAAAMVAVFAHASQFCDPRIDKTFWDTYHKFEIQHGSEDTFREVRTSVNRLVVCAERFLRAYRCSGSSELCRLHSTTRKATSPLALRPLGLRLASSRTSTVQTPCRRSTRPPPNLHSCRTSAVRSAVAVEDLLTWILASAGRRTARLPRRSPTELLPPPQTSTRLRSRTTKTKTTKSEVGARRQVGTVWTYATEENGQKILRSQRELDGQLSL